MGISNNIKLKSILLEYKQIFALFILVHKAIKVRAKDLNELAASAAFLFAVVRWCWKTRPRRC